MQSLLKNWSFLLVSSTKAELSWRQSILWRPNMFDRLPWKSLHPQLSETRSHWAMGSHIYCATLKHVVPPCHGWDSTFHTPQSLWQADTGITQTPGSPIQESPIPWAPDSALAGVCFIQQKHMLAQRHPGEVPVCPRRQEHFIQVSPMLIEMLTYWHCHCIAGFGSKPSKSTTAAASFYWHGHTWIKIWNQEMKQ